MGKANNKPDARATGREGRGGQKKGDRAAVAQETLL
jgi:hypothetical protein